MEPEKRKDKRTEKAEIKKQNQDLPNIPAASERISQGQTAKKEIHQTSKLNKDGKTDNSDRENQPD